MKMLLQRPAAADGRVTAGGVATVFRLACGCGSIGLTEVARVGVVYVRGPGVSSLHCIGIIVYVIVTGMGYLFSMGIGASLALVVFGSAYCFLVAVLAR